MQCSLRREKTHRDDVDKARGEVKNLLIGEERETVRKLGQF